MDEEPINPSKALCGLCNETKTFCFTYGCRHYYCLNCIATQLNKAIDSEEFTAIKCPKDDCSHVPKDSLIRDFVTTNMFDKYLSLKIKYQSRSDFSMFITTNSSSTIETRSALERSIQIQKEPRTTSSNELIDKSYYPAVKEPVKKTHTSCTICDQFTTRRLECGHLICYSCGNLVRKTRSSKVICPVPECKYKSKESSDEIVIDEIIDLMEERKLLDHAIELSKEAQEDNLSNCQICLDEFQDKKLEHFGCRHKYCRPCLVKYLEKIYEFEQDKMPCPSPNCTQVIPRVMAKNLLSGASKEQIESDQDLYDIVDFPNEQGASNFQVENSSPLLSSNTIGTSSTRVSRLVNSPKLESSKSAKIISKVTTRKRMITTIRDAQAVKVKCDICLDDYVKTEMSNFGCDHLFCKDCLIGHIKSKIDMCEVTTLLCPHENCTTNVTDNFIRQYLPQSYQDRYDNLLLKKGVEQLDDVLYCPKCNTMVECDLAYCNGICDRCQFVFCTSCMKEFHGSTDCTTVRQHNEQEVKSLSLIKTIFKKCPGCKIDIEKEVIGCNHMTCKCGTQFCWKCLDKIPEKDNTIELERHYSKCQLFEYNLDD